MVHAQTLLSRADTPGPVQQQEARSFWSYVFSQRFAWHLVWLSVIQLWHYLFIGTLNNLLTKLAVGDRDLGIWRSWEAVSQHIPAGDLEPRGCGALSSAGLCAPEEGLSRGVGRRARTLPYRVLSCKAVLEIYHRPLSVLCSQQLHERLCHHAVLRSTVRPLEWLAHGPAEAEVPEGGEKDR